MHFVVKNRISFPSNKNVLEEKNELYGLLPRLR